MQNNYVRDSLIALLGGAKRTVGRTVLLTGPWGCGKTHLWRRGVAPHLGRRTVYLSAFGAESPEQLKARLITQVLIGGGNAATPGTLSSPTFREKLAKLMPKGWALASASLDATVGHLLSKVQLDPVELASLLDPGTIICIDDIERTAPSFSMESLLGVANVLSEHKKFDVLLICNEEKISGGDQESAYRRHKEKAVTTQLALQANPEELYEQVLKDSVNNSDSLKRALQAKSLVVGIFERSSTQNLRQLARVFSFIDLYLRASVAGIDDERLRFLCAVTLESEGRSRSKDFYQFSEVAIRMAMRADRKETSEKATQQRDFIERYFGESDYVFDQAVFDLVCNGFVSAEAIRGAGPQIQPTTPLGDALKRASTHGWMYLSDSGVRNLVSDLCGALVSDGSAPAQVLLEGLAFARLLAETVTFLLPPDIGEKVTERLRARALAGDSIDSAWDIYASTLAQRVAVERAAFEASAEECAKNAVRRVIEDRINKGELVELARVVYQTQGDALRSLLAELTSERLLRARKSLPEGFLLLTQTTVKRMQDFRGTWPEVGANLDALVLQLRRIQADDVEEKMDKWRAGQVLMRLPPTSGAAGEGTA